MMVLLRLAAINRAPCPAKARHLRHQCAVLHYVKMRLVNFENKVPFVFFRCSVCSDDRLGALVLRAVEWVGVCVHLLAFFKNYEANAPPLCAQLRASTG